MTNKIFSTPEVSIYQGDALGTLQTLPDGQFDAVLTDPPYSSGGLTLSTRQGEPGQKYQRTGTKVRYPALLGDHKDQRSFVYWSTLWLFECWRVTKDGGATMIFTDWRQLPSMTDAMQAGGWSWLGILPWDKRSARPSLGRFRQQCEFVLFGSRGKFKVSTRACLPGLFSYPVIARHKVHLTGKPLPLVADLLAVTPQGGTILDPFVGGGTTALAALETGRKCVGIELSEEYAAITVDRLKKAAQDRA